MKKTLERSKNKAYPKAVTSLEEISDKFKDRKIMDEYGYDHEKEAVFYVGTEIAKDFGFTVFKSQYVIDFIRNTIGRAPRKFLMDGTFDSLPKGFYQLIIIAIEYENEVSANKCVKKLYFVRSSVRLCVLVGKVEWILLCDLSNFFKKVLIFDF